MTGKNKVIWSEGLFLKPQHFQQQERYIADLIDKRSRALHFYGWGILSLEIDTNQLGMGKFAISSARGVMPDGTPFNIPGDDAVPAAIDFKEGVVGKTVYLALPLQTFQPDVDDGSGDGGLFRYQSEIIDVPDQNSRSQAMASMQLGKTSVALKLEGDQLSEYCCIPIAYIEECSAEKKITLDKGFIPTVLASESAAVVSGFLAELKGLLRHRSQTIAARVSAGSGGAAELADFLMLQVINRHIPIIEHIARDSGVHPESLYLTLASLAGEMATFGEPRTPPPIEPYRHHDLKLTFNGLFQQLRDALSTVVDPRAYQISMMEPKYGIYRAALEDKQLVNDAEFVLAIKADLSQDELRRSFPLKTRVSSVETIRDLVMAGLPGIPLESMAQVPRQIPYHAGYVYFQMNKHDVKWKEMLKSSGFAIHVGDGFPGLEMELWAIRN
ncbi:MAG: type VI secretion system baseplate subunit TssK [Pseudomonadales bacterium]|nr:type VI secretion system baseplate subunit TssK [Pseudomonadales bacterium]